MSVQTGTKRKEGGFAETVRVVIHALIIALVIRTFLFQPFNIPSGSMIPTLLVGDYLFVSKYSYGYTHYSLPFSPPIFSGRIIGQPVNRGDVVVFRLPKDDTTDYIKRVIGLPGDRIQMIDGVLNINGEPVKRERDRGFRHRRRRRRPARQALSRDAAERRELHHARSHRQRLLRQYAGLHGAAGSLFHDGRQPRQLDRQPRAQRRSAMCPTRTSSAGRRSFSSRSGTARTPGKSGAGRGRCAGPDCSPWCDERPEQKPNRSSLRNSRPPLMSAAGANRGRRRNEGQKDVAPPPPPRRWFA